MIRVVAAVTIFSLFSLGGAAALELLTPARAFSGSPDSSLTQRHNSPAVITATPGKCSGARRGIVYYRAKTWDYQARHDEKRSRTAFAERSPGCAYARWAAQTWRNRALSARGAFRAWFRRVYAKWACVHRREAAWNDQNAPHYGGLQFDDDFQSTYGPAFVRRWGDAGNWPVWSQLLAAERAYHGYAGYGPRGFHPWPNTARMCGLIG